MQQFVIDRPGKNFFIVEKVQLLPVRQSDLPMFAEEIVQRRGPGLLRASHDKIQFFDFMRTETKHDRPSASAPGPQFQEEQVLTRTIESFFRPSRGTSG